ncbi:MAG: hypothetical protein Q8M36_28115 [Reyranella sp.]|nr:hypothetical protein [Reyranella sp.]MDP2377509.1 hypothetical protein [Reyranella sp.]
MANLEDSAAGLPGGKYRFSIRRDGGDGLFQEDMLAGVECLLRGEAMKMIGQGNEHCVDRRIRKRRSEIRAASGLRKVDVRLHLGDACGGGVDKPDDLNSGKAGSNPSQGPATIAKPHNRATKRTIGRRPLLSGAGGSNGTQHLPGSLAR